MSDWLIEHQIERQREQISAMRREGGDTSNAEAFLSVLIKTNDDIQARRAAMARN
jgi:hypothetical protein